MRLALVISLALLPTSAIADCTAAENALLDWFEERYGADSAEVAEMRTGSVETRWGLLAATYISAVRPILESATEESVASGGPLIQRSDLEENELAFDISETARVIRLAGDVVECLRPDGGPMMIDGRDMGAQFDRTHPSAQRAAIRSATEIYR